MGEHFAQVERMVLAAPGGKQWVLEGSDALGHLQSQRSPAPLECGAAQRPSSGSPRPHRDRHAAPGRISHPSHQGCGKWEDESRLL